MRIGEGLTRAEQETVIRRSADEAQWEIYSSDPSVCRKLMKKFKPVEDDDMTNCRHFIVSNKAVSFRSPRIISEEQRKAMGSRFIKSIKTKLTTQE